MKKIFSRIPKIRHKTVIIVYKNTQFSEFSMWWHMGNNNGKPGMQITGDFLATNITQRNVLLTGAILKKSKNRGMVSVKEANSKYFGDYPILPGCTAQASFHFWVEPPLKQQGQKFIEDIAIIDQFGNKHWFRNVEFKNI